MKYVARKDGMGAARLELSRRNLIALLGKLDDPLSARTLMKQEDPEEGHEWVMVVAVEDDEHYAERPPGEVHMPTTGETY